MAKINTIVFDLGGVLVDWNPDYVFKDLIPDPEERKWFYDHVCTPDWNEEQDAGRTIADANELLIKQYPQHEKMIRAFYERWEDMLGGPIQETVDILRHLKLNTSLKLYALTNWSAETFPIALTKYDFLHWFDGRLVSGEEKIRKPFPIIYETLIERFHIEPSRAIYIDDNPRNLHPAAAMGFTTIHFQDPEQFRKQLEDCLAVGRPH